MGALGNQKNSGTVTTAASVAQSAGQTPKASEYHRPKTSKQNNHSYISNSKGPNKTPSVTIQISHEKPKKSRDYLTIYTQTLGPFFSSNTGLFTKLSTPSNKGNHEGTFPGSKFYPFAFLNDNFRI